jgi:hypothetical protein
MAQQDTAATAVQETFTVLADVARHRAGRGLAATLGAAALSTGLLAAAATPTAQSAAGKHPAISAPSRPAGPPNEARSSAGPAATR